MIATVKTSLSLSCTFISKIGHPPHSVDGRLGSSHAFVLWLLADRVLQIPYICKDNGLNYHRLFFTLSPEYFIVFIALTLPQLLIGFMDLLQSYQGELNFLLFVE